MTQTIHQILDDIGIAYQQYDHPPVFTVEEAAKYDRGHAGHSKNLFLRNKKGNRHFLVVLGADKQVNIRDIADAVGENNLGFASPERLLKYLGLTPGSVSPFGLVNDTAKGVEVIVDNELLKSDNQGFHPNINTSTLILSTEDFKKFLSSTGNKVTYLEVT